MCLEPVLHSEKSHLSEKCTHCTSAHHNQRELQLRRQRLQLKIRALPLSPHPWLGLGPPPPSQPVPLPPQPPLPFQAPWEIPSSLGFPGGSLKNLPAVQEKWANSPGEGKGYSLQYSCLESLHPSPHPHSFRGPEVEGSRWTVSSSSEALRAVPGGQAWNPVRPRLGGCGPCRPPKSSCVPVNLGRPQVPLDC